MQCVLVPSLSGTVLCTQLTRDGDWQLLNQCSVGFPPCEVKCFYWSPTGSSDWQQDPQTQQLRVHRRTGRPQHQQSYLRFQWQGAKEHSSLLQSTLWPCAESTLCDSPDSTRNFTALSLIPSPDICFIITAIIIPQLGKWFGMWSRMSNTKSGHDSSC